MDAVYDDKSSHVSKEEFIAYAQTRMEYSDAFVILPDDVWNSFDEDGDDSLSVTEFMSAVDLFDLGKIKGTPWLVYSLQETKHLTDFYVNDESSSSSNDEYTAIALAPNADTTMPISNALWQSWYEDVMTNYSSFSFASPNSYTESGGPVTMGVTDAPEMASAFIPLVARTSANAVQIAFNKDAESTKTSGFDALLSTYFPSSSAISDCPRD